MNIVQRLRKTKRSLLRLNLRSFLVLMIASLLTIQFLILPAFTQQRVTVRLFMQALEAAQWQPYVEEFEQQNPDINLEIMAGPNDTNLIEDLYTSAFLLGDSPYDLVYMDIVWVPKFAAAGWLLPLSDRVSQFELADFLEGDVNGGMYEGELYRMPFRSDAGMLYYRTDLLAQEGLEPPQTFQELIEISQTIQQNTDVDWGYLWQGRQYEGISAMFIEVLEGFGGFWVNPETLEVGIDSQNAVEAMEFLRTTIETGVSPTGVTTYGEEETRRIFQAGNAVFLRNWPYVYSLAEDSPIAGQYAIQPMVSQPGETSGAAQGGWGLGISRETRHPNEAWRVIEYFTSREVQKAYVAETGYVPSRTALFTDPDLVARYEYFPQLQEVVENAVLRPPIPQYAQASDILQRYLSAALTGRMGSQQALQAAANETRQLFGDM